MADWNVCVTDLDGTLLDSRGQLDPVNVAALKRLMDNGIHVVVATGRTHLMMREIIDAIGVRLPVIACNGAMIRDMRTGDMDFCRTIAPEKVRVVLEFCRKREWHVMFYTMETIFYNAGNTRIERFERYNEAAEAHLRIPLHPDEEWLSQTEPVPVVKMLIHDDDPTVGEAVEAACNEDGALQIVSSSKGLFDIMSAGSTKGAALARMAGMHGWDPARIIVFGDNHNDLSMFEAAGLSVAVGNAEPEVLDAADRVTRSNDEHGVAYMIAQLFPAFFPEGMS